MRTTSNKRNSRRGKNSGGGMKELWNQAKEEAKDSNFGDAVPLEPGAYRMQLVSASIDDIQDVKTLLTKWCVLDEEDEGVICTDFQKIETAEQMVWAQRLMLSLGLDIDAVDPEDDNDILEVFNEAIDDGIASKVKVIAKDGYTNMRIGKAIEVDEDDLFDPKEALGKSKKSESKKSSSRSSRRGKKKEKLTVEQAEKDLEDLDKAGMKDYIAEHDLDVSVSRKDSEDTIYDNILDAVEAL